MELEKSVRMMERNVMAMEVSIIILINLISIISITIITICISMIKNIGGQPRGRRLGSKAEIRGTKATEHSGQDVEAVLTMKKKTEARNTKMRLMMQLK